ncbi:MAG: caspase family protein [bacterium]
MINKTLLFSIVTFTIFFSLSISLSSTHENFVIIRSESAYQIDHTNHNREKAIHNAILKSIKSHIGDIAILAKSESDNLIPIIESKINSFFSEYNIVSETTYDDTIKIITDVHIISEKLVLELLENIKISSFRYKPTILIVLPNDQKALTTELEKGFSDLGFRVINKTAYLKDIQNSSDFEDIDKISDIAKSSGSDVVITGSSEWIEQSDSRLGKMKSWRIVSSLKAVRCFDRQILTAGNYEAVEVGISEDSAKKKVSAKIAQNIIKDFPKNIMRFWATDVATGKISPSQLDSSSPPSIIIKSPKERAVVKDPSIRLIAHIKFSQQTGDTKITINGTSLALDRDQHILETENLMIINRHIPLKTGENLISISAIDQNNNSSKKELHIYFNPFTNEKDNSDLKLVIHTPIDNSVSEGMFIPLKGEIITNQEISSVSVFINNIELNASFYKDPSEGLYRIHRTIPLQQEQNLIKIKVQTASGAEKESYVTVFLLSAIKPSKPEIFIYDPIDSFVTDNDYITIRAEILSIAEIDEISISNNNILQKENISAHIVSIAPYNLYEINEVIQLKNGMNLIEILTNNLRKSLNVIYTQSEKMPQIIIESPLPNQKLSSGIINLIGKIISPVPMNDDIEITVNGNIRASRGMKLANRFTDNEIIIPINETITLIPGNNEIKIKAYSVSGQMFDKTISVTFLPDRSFNFNVLNENGKRYSVIIGINEYKNDGITSLSVAKNDAQAIYNLITDPMLGGFPKENVRLLTDAQASRENIIKIIGDWLPNQVSSDDLVMIFYAGHGGVEFDKTGEEPDGKRKYIIPYDANPNDLFSTAIANSEITILLEKIQSNKMIFLIDCCYSGGVTTGKEIIRSVSPPSTKIQTDVYNDFSGSGRAVISASLPDQVSFELSNLNHGVFTYSLLKALSGEADLNKDGLVALISEIYPFLANQVTSMAQKYGFQQNPMLKCQVIGDLILTKVNKYQDF